MNETCDRCGPAVRAAYRASRSGQLYLCRHCANRLRPALTAQGWHIWPMAAPAGMPLGLHPRPSHMNHLPRHSDTAAGLHTNT